MYRDQLGHQGAHNNVHLHQHCTHSRIHKPDPQCQPTMTPPPSANTGKHTPHCLPEAPIVLGLGDALLLLLLLLLLAGSGYCRSTWKVTMRRLLVEPLQRPLNTVTSDLHMSVRGPLSTANAAKGAKLEPLQRPLNTVTSDLQGVQVRGAC
jgi:hypothetical protein